MKAHLRAKKSKLRVVFIYIVLHSARFRATSFNCEMCVDSYNQNVDMLATFPDALDPSWSSRLAPSWSSRLAPKIRPI